MKSNSILTTCSALACTIATIALLFGTLGCDSSNGTSNNSSANAGDGFLVVENITARDFIITLTGANFTQTNETTAAGSTPMLTTNITTATDGVTMVTNVVNNPISTTVTNAMLEVVTPTPITREAKRQLTTVLPIAPNTYRAVFQVANGVRGGEVSVIIREDARTRVSVLLDPADGTGLQLSVFN